MALHKHVFSVVDKKVSNFASLALSTFFSSQLWSFCDVEMRKELLTKVFFKKSSFFIVWSLRFRQLLQGKQSISSAIEIPIWTLPAFLLSCFRGQKTLRNCGKKQLRWLLRTNKWLSLLTCVLLQFLMMTENNRMSELNHVFSKLNVQCKRKHQKMKTKLKSEIQLRLYLPQVTTNSGRSQILENNQF